MESGELVALIVGSSAFGGFVTKTIEGIIKGRQGKHHTEQTIWNQRDYHAKRHYMAVEYASLLRRDLIELDVPPDKIRPWPDT